MKIERKRTALGLEQQSPLVEWGLHGHSPLGGRHAQEASWGREENEEKWEKRAGIKLKKKSRRENGGGIIK